MAPIPAGTNQIRAEVLALLASLWLYTELLFGRIRRSRTEAPSCPPKTQHSRGCKATEALRHNGSHGSRTNAAAS
jgi:hypothetical protein